MPSFRAAVLALVALLAACEDPLPAAPDAGRGDSSDASSPVPDAETPLVDAGEASPDAGDTTPDAGEPPDAGDTTPDAGTPNRVEGPDGWSWTEALVADDVPEPAERWRTECERHDTVRALFDDARPRSDRGLLHHRAGGDGFPVLLVHGANSEALESFGPSPFGELNPGLAWRLADAGHPVYAVTFAHPHGGNLLQARVLAAALARIGRLESAPVRVVAHSKGNVAAWALLSGLAGEVPANVSQWVAVGAPLDGIDFTFAWPSTVPTVVANAQCAPLPWDVALLYGVWTDTLDRSLYAGGAYPGQAELLVRHDATAGLSLLQTDAVTTYEGGQGFISHSLGIDEAIVQGGRLMERLAEAGLPERIGFRAIAGDSALFGLVVGESRAASDGLLLLASATATERVGRPGTATVLHLNHVDLVGSTEGQEAIVAALE